MRINKWGEILMSEITECMRAELFSRGAVLVGFGDLSAIPEDIREGLPVGISVAVKYPKEVIRGISQLPTAEYHQWYCTLNEKLDAIVTHGAQFLRSKGFRAVERTRQRVNFDDSKTEYQTDLPHKTVATRAGIGWIGKCAMLVTEEYGSMVRLSSILTDAPIDCAVPVDKSRCGECTVCVEACPAKAVSGKLWHAGLAREEFFDAIACEKTAKERSRLGFGGTETICGKCIEVCPYTKSYLNRAD